MHTKKNCPKIYLNRILSNSSRIGVLKYKNYFPLDPNDPCCCELYHLATRGNLIWAKRAKRKAKYVSKVMVQQVTNERDDRSDLCFFQGIMNARVNRKGFFRRGLSLSLKSTTKLTMPCFGQTLRALLCKIVTRALRNRFRRKMKKCS
jgi:hypothetical protein